MGRSTAGMISANQLTVLQSCARRAVIERDWRIRKWRPRALFNHCMQQLVFEVSAGKDATRAGMEAYTHYLSQSANPGLDLAYGMDPYTLACDFAVALRVLAQLLSRVVLLPLHPSEPVLIMRGVEGGYSWRPESLEDESGALHWWHGIEHYSQNVLVTEGHSWRWGDMAACEVPLNLHLVELGYVRHGRLHGDLTRIYKHPAVAKYQFQHRSGKELQLGWKATWLQDLGEKVMPYQRWCDQLSEDKVNVIYHVPMKQPELWQREEFVNEVTAEMDRMEKLPLNWRAVPKSRGACDILGGCPHQRLCYGPEDATPETVGGYVKR